ncbi:hypothetical protein MOB78_05635 [Bacillus spizizenii]|nr:hypothetical protein [Bacillus spizizenii]
MKKMFKKKSNMVIISIVTVALILSFSSVGLALSKGYHFTIRTQVTGAYNKDLGNKGTKITASAKTIKDKDGTTLSQKHKYTVKIDKQWGISSYNTGKLTTGSNYTKNFGKITKGTYRVNVTKHTYSDYGIVIDGGGKITQ